MLKKTALALLACLAFAGCASDKPHVVQASGDTSIVSLTKGMATQIEMPEGERVTSVVTGKPSLVIAEKAENVVNLIPTDETGETNLIVRATDGHESKVYQYKVIVQ